MRFIKKIKLEVAHQLGRYIPISVKKGLPQQSKLYGNIFYNRRSAVLGHSETFIKELDFTDATIIEIGSNIGEYSIYFGLKLGRGQLIAVEPNPISFELLCKNIKTNMLNNVMPLNCGISNQNGELTFVSDRYNRATGTFKTTKQNALRESKLKNTFKIKIPVKTGDQIAKDMCLQNVDYIKIDTEGFEPFVIEGLPQILEEKKPILTFEIHGKTAEEKTADLRQIHNFLKKFNYKAYKLSGKMEELTEDNAVMLIGGSYVAFSQPKINVEKAMRHVFDKFGRNPGKQ